jgi:hypothetical protein
VAAAGAPALLSRKIEACSFADHLSRPEGRLSMSKGERISKLVQELAPQEAAAADPTGIAQNEFYCAFFRCWNEQQYYEAHDVLEQLWLRTRSDDAQFFKGLIQAAGAFVHLRKQFEHPTHPKHGRRLGPAERLFSLARQNLAPFAPNRHRLDVAKLCALLDRYAEEIRAGRYEKNPWSPEAAPKLHLR